MCIRTKTKIKCPNVVDYFLSNPQHYSASFNTQSNFKKNKHELFLFLFLIIVLLCS